MNEKLSPSPKKRGPKPIGDAPMTAAERKRRSRARQVADGTRAEFMISLAGETLAFVDFMARSNEVSRSRVVQEFLGMAIEIVHGAAVRADQMLAEGASMDEIQNLMRQAFTAPKPRTHEDHQEVAHNK